VAAPVAGPVVLVEGADVGGRFGGDLHQPDRAAPSCVSGASERDVSYELNEIVTGLRVSS
jgi:hypothetical protein